MKVEASEATGKHDLLILICLSSFVRIRVDSWSKTRSAKREIIYKDESYKIIGACFEVYNEVGCGFDEQVYQECLELEFGLQSLACAPHVMLPITFKGRLLQKYFKPDFVCFNKIILEIKAVASLDDAHRSQVHNYLKATGYRLGLLVNFGARPKLEYERIAA